MIEPGNYNRAELAEMLRDDGIAAADNERTYHRGFPPPIENRSALSPETFYTDNPNYSSGEEGPFAKCTNVFAEKYANLIDMAPSQDEHHSMVVEFDTPTMGA